MTHRADDIAAPHHPGLVYAERWRNLGFGGAAFADEWQALPRDLNDAAGAADQVIVVDPLSFPFEDLDERGWERPLVLIWPDDHSPQILIDLLDKPVLSRLTFFDRIAVRSDAVWERLQERYRFAESQRVATRDLSVADVVEQLLQSGSASSFAQAEAGLRMANTLDPWSLRSTANKKTHLIEFEAVRAAIVRAAALQPTGVALRTVQIGFGIGRFLPAFADHSFVGFARGPAVVTQAQSNYPLVDIKQIGRGNQLALTREHFDFVIATHEMSRLRSPQRRALIGSAWKALRVGGRLAILDTFVPQAHQQFMAADELMDDLIRATDHMATLANVESLRSNDSPTHDVGIITATKIGVPTKW